MTQNVCVFKCVVSMILTLLHAFMLLLRIADVTEKNTKHNLNETLSSILIGWTKYPALGGGAKMRNK